MQDLAKKLTRWRHLIEPETSSGLTPVAWDAVLRMPLLVLEGDKSVLVLRDCVIDGHKVRSIWVAAGELAEVLQLVRKAEADAKQCGIGAMVFMGRRGWVRAADYREVATCGHKEL
jgi:hypothetical protein